MFVTEAVSINKLGHLEIGGNDCVQLAKEYKTPLYVMDENLLRKNCRIYKNAMDKYYNGNGLVLYASKALCTEALCKIAEQEGLGLDVVSGGELYTAIAADFPMNKVYFHGNNKTIQEIKMGIDNNIRRFVVDNIEELYNINKIAEKKGKVAKISFRIKPGIDAHTHDFIKTGQIDSKFGVALENGEAYEIIKIASCLRNVEVMGVHCHIGSQIFDIDPFKLAAKVMINFMAEIKKEFKIEISELNLGGGFGIKYTKTDDPIKYDSYIASISKIVKATCKEKDIKLPFILMEPGRSIVCSAGITLYTVGSVKEIKDVRTYVSVDGSMNDNPRYALYKAKYEAVLVNDVNSKPYKEVTIAGKCCESGDIIIKDIIMPRLKAGDIIATFATGAYNYSMSANYNRMGRPPIVLVKDGNSKLIVKRETYEDIIRNDILPEDL